nr:coat protein [Lake Sarah-associated circular virus-15]
MPPRRVRRQRKRPARKYRQKGVRTKKGVKALVTRVINAKAETKMVAFYGGPIANPSPLRNSTGTYADSAPTSQNQYISVNATDILKVIPDVAPGNADNERTGRYINPTSLQLHCKVGISPISTGGSGYQNGWAYDIIAVAYLLQHVEYKTYQALYTNNNFAQLLDVMEGTTVQFNGDFSSANMPVEKGYYRVLGKKKISLRSSGAYNPAAGILNTITNNNSHQLSHEWTWNVGKHLPKKLIYPEGTVSVANGQNEPLNAAPFWAVGYYNVDGTGGSPATAKINIQQQYTAIMKFKDF